MSHGIGTVDFQEGRAMAWHKLTSLRPDLTIDNCRLPQSDVEIGFLRSMVDGAGKLLPLGNAKGLAKLFSRLDDGGIVWVGPEFDTGTYAPFTNRQFVKLFGQICDKAGWSRDIESAGTVFDRSRVFASKEIKRTKDSNGREFVWYFSLHTSHDKTLELTGSVSGTCIVCNNTLTLVDSLGGLSIPHTPGCMSEPNLARVPEMVARATQSIDEFSGDWLRAESVEITKSQAHGIFLAMLATGTGENAKVSARAEGVAAELACHFAGSPGAYGRTLADAVQAITYHWTHKSVANAEELEKGDTRAMVKQWESSEFGLSKEFKTKQWEFFRQLSAKPEGIPDLVAIGFRALERGRAEREGKKIARLMQKTASGQIAGAAIKQLGDGRAS